ncbi:hypothetical protein ACFL2M_02375 [Patescibacteria group bacterium]
MPTITDGGQEQAVGPTDDASVNVTIKGEEFLHLQDSAVVIGRAGDIEAAAIAANNPSAVAWSHDQAAIFWVEEQEPEEVLAESSVPEAFVLQRFDLATGEQEQVYWSRSAITDLTVSIKTKLLAFIQDDALYVYSLESERVQRIAEHIKSYEWSSELQTMLVITEEGSFYVELLSDGTIFEQTVLETKLAQQEEVEEDEAGQDEVEQDEAAEEVVATLSSLTFKDRRTALGLLTSSSGTRLVQIDLRDNEITDLGAWEQLEAPEVVEVATEEEDDEVAEAAEEEAAEEEAADDAAEDTAPSYKISLFLSPDGDNLIIEESYVSADQVQLAVRFSKYSLKRSQVEELDFLTGGEIVGWSDDETIIIAKPTLNGIVGDRYQVFSADITSQKETDIAQDITFPVFI